MPSVTASVSGRRIWKVVPLPSTEVISMRPRIDSMLRRTTSMPTPRPEMSVSCSAVLKPGAKMRALISESVSDCDGETRPFSIALARMRSRLRPRPSSFSSTITLPPCWKAESITRPERGLPPFSRSAGPSTPWSTALRTMCTSGSAMASTMLRSSSVSSPSVTNSTTLPAFSATSRTRRVSFWKVGLSGTMRMDMLRSCSSRMILPACETFFTRS